MLEAFLRTGGEGNGIPQTPKTHGNNEGSGKRFGRETRLQVLECPGSRSGAELKS